MEQDPETTSEKSDLVLARTNKVYQELIEKKVMRNEKGEAKERRRNSEQESGEEVTDEGEGVLKVMALTPVAARKKGIPYKE